MDLLKKIETLLNAKARSPFPKRGRRSILDDDEERILAEIRQALRDVEAQERILARRIKDEQTLADEAAGRGDLEQRRTHERRAFELERQLEQESLQAINIEEKLAALEDKLALAREAVEKEARHAAERDAAAEKVLSGHEAAPQAEAPPPPRPRGQRKSVSERKSRLSG
ncbi:MAG: hypothetical protein R3264_11360 [Anaerolineae bacterium]|nr:hypothetical protein [Anaerolineae bacterium]